MKINATNRDTKRETNTAREATINYWWTSIAIIVNIYSKNGVTENDMFTQQHE